MNIYGYGPRQCQNNVSLGVRKKTQNESTGFFKRTILDNFLHVIRVSGKL